MTINIVEWAVENIKTWPDSSDPRVIRDAGLPDQWYWERDQWDGAKLRSIHGEALCYETWFKHKSQKDIGSKIVKAIIPDLLDMEANLTIQQIMQVVQAVINTCDVEVK